MASVDTELVEGFISRWSFQRAKPADVAEILETLVTLGRARHGGGSGGVCDLKSEI